MAEKNQKCTVRLIYIGVREQGDCGIRHQNYLERLWNIESTEYSIIMGTENPAEKHKKVRGSASSFQLITHQQTKEY